MVGIIIEGQTSDLMEKSMLLWWYYLWVHEASSTPEMTGKPEVPLIESSFLKYVQD